MYESDVTASTGSPQCIVRSGNSEVQCDFAGGIISHYSGIMMVRPIFHIVVELLDFVDFVFSFDRAVLGNPEVDANPRFVEAGKVQSGISYCFVGTVNSNGACPRSPAQILLLLILQGLEVT